jgi:dTDP-L-rhamnose 4-epimerase
MYEIARYVGANDLGTAVLLEALIEHPVERLVVASSMSVYGEGLYRTGRARRRPMRAARSASAGAGSRWMPDGEPLTPVPPTRTKPVDLASIYALTNSRRSAR